MYDHVVFNVRDFGAGRALYDGASTPLGYRVVMDFGKAVAFGTDDRPTFSIFEHEPYGTATPVAFACDDRETVAAFYATALAAGGNDNGPPGLGEQYHPTCYAAFACDLDGNNIEAVCHPG